MAVANALGIVYNARRGRSVFDVDALIHALALVYHCRAVMKHWKRVQVASELRRAA